jgi:hypothetical protein
MSLYASFILVFFTDFILEYILQICHIEYILQIHYMSYGVYIADTWVHRREHTPKNELTNSSTAVSSAILAA